MERLRRFFGRSRRYEGTKTILKCSMEEQNLQKCYWRDSHSDDSYAWLL